MMPDLSAERGHSSRDRYSRRLRPISSLRDSCLCLLVLLVAVIVITAVLTLAFFVLRDLSEKLTGEEVITETIDIEDFLQRGRQAEGEYTEEDLAADVITEVDWYHPTEAMSEAGNLKTSSSSESSSSTTSSGSEIGTDIELSPSSQPIKPPEQEPEPQPPPPPAPVFSSDDGDIEEEIGEDEDTNFPPEMPFPPSEDPYSGQFPGDGGQPEPPSPPSEDPFSGQYPETQEPAAGPPPAASDDVFSGQLSGGMGLSGSATPPPSSWSREDTPGPPSAGSDYIGQSQGPMGSAESDHDTDQFNPFASQARGPVSPPPSEHDTESDPWDSTAPAGFGPSAGAQENVDWDHGSSRSGFQSSSEAQEASSSPGGQANKAPPTATEVPSQLESPFDTTLTGASNDQNADPWTSNAPTGFGPSSAASIPANNFAGGPPAGLEVSASAETSSSSDDSDSDEDTVIAVTDAPAASPPVAPAVNADFQEDSLFSGGLFDDKLSSQAPESVDGDRFDPPAGAGLPEEKFPPASPAEPSEQQEIDEPSLFPQGSNNAFTIESENGIDTHSGTTSSTSSSSSSEVEPENHVGTETLTKSPSQLMSTHSTGATQGQSPSVRESEGEQPPFTSPLHDEPPASTPPEEGQLRFSPAGVGSPTTVASPGSSSPGQTASKAPSQKSSLAKTASSVSRRRSSLGQTASVTSRRRPSLSQTASTKSQERSHQTSPPSSPPGRADSRVPPEEHSGVIPHAEEQTGLGGASSSGPSSPVRSRGSIASSRGSIASSRGSIASSRGSIIRSRGSIVSGSTSRPSEVKASIFATQSSDLFKTAPAFTGGRVSTDAIAPRPVPSADSRRGQPGGSPSRGGDRPPPQTAESRRGEEQEPRSPENAVPDQATSATEASPAAADSQAAHSPPATLANLLAGSTLASLARDGLSRLAPRPAAPPSSDSDSDPGRGSGAARLSESHRRQSQQPSRTGQNQSQSRQPSQPSQSRSQQQSQSQSRQTVRIPASQQQSQLTQKQSQLQRQKTGNSAARQVKPAQREQKFTKGREQSKENSQRTSNPADTSEKQSQSDFKRAKGHQTSDQGRSQLDSRTGMTPPESTNDRASESLSEQRPDAKEASQTPEEFKSQTSLVAGCRASRLRFCDGRLPYRTTSLPNFAGASSDQQLVDNLIYFEALSDSGCSPLVTEYVCAAMEPQCVSRPAPHTLPPCRHFCQDVAARCDNEITARLGATQAFNCSRLPDSTDPRVCYSSAADRCIPSEFACADQTACLPAEWRCDGNPQCDDDSDELGCDGCSALQYRCRPAGGCVTREQLCDGFADCTEGDDERDCIPPGAEFVSASSSVEHHS